MVTLNAVGESGMVEYFRERFTSEPGRLYTPCAIAVASCTTDCGSLVDRESPEACGPTGSTSKFASSQQVLFSSVQLNII